eukprot:6128694-Amphidinium_carterae.3
METEHVVNHLAARQFLPPRLVHHFVMEAFQPIDREQERWLALEQVRLRVHATAGPAPGYDNAVDDVGLGGYAEVEGGAQIGHAQSSGAQVKRDRTVGRSRPWWKVTQWQQPAHGRGEMAQSLLDRDCGEVHSRLGNRIEPAAATPCTLRVMSSQSNRGFSRSQEQEIDGQKKWSDSGSEELLSIIFPLVIGDWALESSSDKKGALWSLLFVWGGAVVNRSSLPPTPRDPYAGERTVFEPAPIVEDTIAACWQWIVEQETGRHLSFWHLRVLAEMWAISAVKHHYMVAGVSFHDLADPLNMSAREYVEVYWNPKLIPNVARSPPVLLSFVLGCIFTTNAAVVDEENVRPD